MGQWGRSGEQGIRGSNECFLLMHYCVFFITPRFLNNVVVRHYTHYATFSLLPRHTLPPLSLLAHHIRYHYAADDATTPRDIRYYATAMIFRDLPIMKVTANDAFRRRINDIIIIGHDTTTNTCTPPAVATHTYR